MLAANLGRCPGWSDWELLIVAERIARALLESFQNPSGQKKDREHEMADST
jgi:hypothetical protein